MGRYLNMANNNKANPAKNTSANENYARELMQLFTLGLTQLNPNGTPVLDQNNNPIPTYDQTVVTNMAKVLTGWTYPTAPGAKPKNNNPQYFFGQMFAVEAEHDTSAKTIFGNVTIPAGQTAEQDLDSLLDALMAQPTMAPFVSTQLIQHLVTSNPSPAVRCAGIQRVSERWQRSDGKSAGGDRRHSHRPGSARGRRSNRRVDQPDVRPPAGTGPVHAQSAARPERHAHREQRHLLRHLGTRRGSVQRSQRLQLLFAAVSNPRRIARAGVSDLHDADGRGPGGHRELRFYTAASTRARR